MTSTLPRTTQAPRAVPQSTRPRDRTTEPVTARYRYSPPTGTWWWSPEMHALHGVPDDGSAPRTRLLLDLLHPSDRHRARAALAACAEGRPFAVETRVTRPDGGLRTVVLVGEPVTDVDGRVLAIDGMCVDLTAGRHGTENDRVKELELEVAQLRTAMAGRAPIEQAKGILMLLTGCGEQAAFELLTHISSHTHRKVREVAVTIAGSAAGHGRLPDDVSAILRDACPPVPAPG
jgi:ANTAR domain/PAS fold